MVVAEVSVAKQKKVEIKHSDFLKYKKDNTLTVQK